MRDENVLITSIRTLGCAAEDLEALWECVDGPGGSSSVIVVWARLCLARDSQLWLKEILICSVKSSGSRKRNTDSVPEFTYVFDLFYCHSILASYILRLSCDPSLVPPHVDTRYSDVLDCTMYIYCILIHRRRYCLFGVNTNLFIFNF